MTAREMLEAKGYKVMTDNVLYLVYKLHEPEEGNLYISFDKARKTVKSTCDVFISDKIFENLPCDLDMYELRAVIKQYEELGWL